MRHTILCRCNIQLDLAIVHASSEEYKILNFREATLNDVSQLLDLEQSLIDAERPLNTELKADNTTYYDIPSLINDVDSYLIVLELGGKISATGYAQIRRSKRALKHSVHSYMGFMYVAAKLRGKGINRALVEQLIAWSKEKGTQAFYLDVYANNAPAIRAYEKLGFKASTLEMKIIIP